MLLSLRPRCLGVPMRAQARRKSLRDVLGQAEVSS
ncbi:hypothetical protein TTX_1167 [Thermoproteus tenax Kra 1]|uniref:Uncharacterized protein n=1 Tax=Thermoproteus tenax (strain ATCC 35583 / DSM 2078 / JCM 9277 / NBRC 100435 / Kra 1) TaxID=768679 RepID=G4RJR3_THETK|nr:hypothetical protein TTX_1167 [Thermoproteus tenax Kra 1]